MFVDPYELSEDIFNQLCDAGLELFTESFAILDEDKLNPASINQIKDSIKDNNMMVAIQAPNNQWWQEFELYDSTLEEIKEAHSDDATLQAEEYNLDESILDHFVEITVYSSTDDINDAPEGTVIDDTNCTALASMLVPCFNIHQQMNNVKLDPSVLKFTIIQWLPDNREE